MAVDSQWGNVAILLPFEGANNQTIFNEAKRNASVTVGGNSKHSTTSPPTGCTSSAELDGNGDYINIVEPSLAFGTGDWVIEFPLYRLGDGASGASAPSQLLDMRVVGSTNHLLVEIFSSAQANALKMAVYISGTLRITSSTALTNNTWTWITLARVSGTLRLFFDGVSKGSYADGYNHTSTAMRIGARHAIDGSQWYGFYGRIGPVRVTNGNGRGYSADFTPPTLPFDRPKISGKIQDDTLANISRPVVIVNRSSKTFCCGAVSDATTGLYTAYPRDYGEFEVRAIDELSDPYWHQIAFASRLNATGFPTLTELQGTLDYAPHVLTATGSVTASTAVADPFGGSDASALFAGAGTYLTSNGSFLPPTIFTISFWIYVTSLVDYASGVFFIGTFGSNTNRVQLSLSSTGALDFYGAGSSAVFDATTADGVITTNTWYHVACVRYGLNAYVFVDGAHVATGLASGTDPTGTTLHLGYCRISSTTRGLTGRLYDFKYTYRAEYTAPFTKPTALSLAGPVDGGSVANAQILDRITPY